MKKILTAAVALPVPAGTVATNAKPYRNDHRDHRDDRRVEQQYDRRMDKAERKYDRDVRKAERKYRAAAYQRPSGYTYRHWNRGDRLPPAYRADRYRVDYRHYGLRAPPRGYYYTRVDNDVVLTAAATGLVASVIVGMFQ